MGAFGAATPAPADFLGANYCTLAIVPPLNGVLLRPPEGGQRRGFDASQSEGPFGQEQPAEHRRYVTTRALLCLALFASIKTL